MGEFEAYLKNHPGSITLAQLGSLFDRLLGIANNNLDDVDLDGDYDRGYNEGYHDMLVEILNELSIPTTEDYCN